jgi:2-polyprenyl-3-methyl-5-hydroxy-6-metoxy-1,4-benzoquinol methylase
MNRKSHWENIYAEKSPLEVSWFQREPLLSLELIGKSMTDKKAAIIDVGGGTSTLVDLLLDEGYSDITVLDISSRALAISKLRLGENANIIKWIQGDITEFNPSRKYDLWHDRAVFHFLTDVKDQNKYLETLKKTVKNDGYVIIASFAVDGPKKCSGLDIVQYDSKKISDKLGLQFRLVENQPELHLTPLNTQQKFCYFRFLKI